VPVHTVCPHPPAIDHGAGKLINTRRATPCFEPIFEIRRFVLLCLQALPLGTRPLTRFVQVEANACDFNEISVSFVILATYLCSMCMQALPLVTRHLTSCSQGPWAARTGAMQWRAQQQWLLYRLVTQWPYVPGVLVERHG
jgi:hypothetical protein